MRARWPVVVLVLAGGLLAGAPGVAAQPATPAGKVYRIGALGATSRAAYQEYVDAIRDELAKLGYVPGKNITVDARWAQGDYERLPAMAAELVGLKVDVIVTHGPAAAAAAKKATRTIPIVAAVVGDAIGAGLVTNVVRPGGNFTGSTFFWPEVQAKRLKALQDALPGVTRVAILANPDSPNFKGKMLEITELDAKSLGLQTHLVEARGPEDFETAFAAAAKWQAEALVVPEEAVFISHSEQIARLAAGQRLRTAGFTDYAEDGGLVGFGPDLIVLWRRAAWFVDKILRGSKAGDLPMEQPTKFELVINMKTAKALGVEIPEDVVNRADRVIE